VKRAVEEGVERMSESDDERNFSSELEIRTPGWLPGGRIALAFSRKWHGRPAAYTADVASLAGVDTDQLIEQLENNAAFSDLFFEGAQRVIDDGDRVYVDFIARLVSSALRDDARILDAAYLLKKLRGLDALHIRILWALPPISDIYKYLAPLRDDPEQQLDKEALKPLNHERGVALGRVVGATIKSFENHTARKLAESARASVLLVKAASSELIASGFLEEVDFEDLVMRLGNTIQKKLLTSDERAQVLGGRSLHTLPYSLTPGYALSELGLELRQLITQVDGIDE